MKTKPFLITLIGLLVVITVVVQSCKKDNRDDKENSTPPTAIFTVFPHSGTTSYNFAFQASGSTDKEDPTSELQVRWDFESNGSWDTDWDYDKTVNHQYGNADIYSAKLEVKDTEDLTDQYTISITVENKEGGGKPPTGYFIDSRDGQEYGFIDINSQTWMAENLNYETAISWTYNNDPANGNIYGRLYTWEEALTVCPSGWSLPSDDQWKQMEMALGMSRSEADDIGWRGTDEGKKMKSTSGWNLSGNGTNSSGFNAIPGGRLSERFIHFGKGAAWWSSSEYSGTDAWGRGRSYDYDQSFRGHNNPKTSGFSVRCLKD
jgi:uncharacterized protein (TIGR02145 family)